MALETISLIGQRGLFNPEGTSRTFPGDIIVGLETAAGSIEASPDDRRFPRPKPEKRRRIGLTLARQAVERLVAFYERAFAGDERLDYDCLGFALYVVGAEDEPRRGSQIKEGYHVDHSVYMNDLERGVAYGVVGPDITSNHAVLGADSPLHSLSAFGKSVEGAGLLVYTANTHIMDVYEARRIGPLLYEGQVMSDARILAHADLEQV